MKGEFGGVFYIVLQDVFGDQGLVDAGVFVRFQVNQGFFRDALMRSETWIARDCQSRYIAHRTC